MWQLAGVRVVAALVRLSDRDKSSVYPAASFRWQVYGRRMRDIKECPSAKL